MSDLEELRRLSGGAFSERDEAVFDSGYWMGRADAIQEVARRPGVRCFPDAEVALRRAVRNVADRLENGEVAPVDAAALLYGALTGDLSAEFEAVRQLRMSQQAEPVRKCGDGCATHGSVTVRQPLGQHRP